MAATLRTLAYPPPEFRAPPPSPAAGAHNGDLDPLEDDEFSGFLNRSLRVPQLILPDRILHRETAPPPWTPPEIDIRSYDVEVLRSAARSAGCLQIIGHGIEKGLIEEVRALAGRVFRLPPERKREVTRSEEREWGFEAEEEGGDDGEESFWWSGRGDEELAGIWPQGYEDFRYKMQGLWTKMEKIASKIATDLIQNDSRNAKLCSSQLKTVGGSSAISLRIHNRSVIPDIGRGSTLELDILRMMIRNATCSHFLCLHICQGAFRFCLYSKKYGWISFPVRDGAVIVTFGDQIQACSDGLYKHVIGKANFQNKEKDVISVGYLHSPSITDASSFNCGANVGGERIISLAQQIIIAACILFICLWMAAP